MTTIKAWHFTKDVLRDGADIPVDGEKLVYDQWPKRVTDGKIVHRPIELCHRGLHASKRIIDALWYAPGLLLHRVELSGDIEYGKDKTVASERTILWRLDLKEYLFNLAFEEVEKVSLKYIDDYKVKEFLQARNCVYVNYAKSFARHTLNKISSFNVAKKEAFYSVYYLAKACNPRNDSPHETLYINDSIYCAGMSQFGDHNEDRDKMRTYYNKKITGSVMAMKRNRDAR